MLQLHIKSGYSSYLGLLLTVTPLDMEIQSSSVSIISPHLQSPDLTSQFLQLLTMKEFNHLPSQL